MKNTFTKKWAKAATIRAIKTFSQTALAGFTVGATVTEVDWPSVLSVALVAAIASVLTSVAGLPEVTDEEDSEYDDFFHTETGEPINYAVFVDEDGNEWTVTKVEENEEEEEEAEDESND